MPRTERTRHLLLLAGAFALLAAACSGGSDDAVPADPAPADGGSTEDADATGDEVPTEASITFTGSRHDLVPTDAGGVFDEDFTIGEGIQQGLATGANEHFVFGRFENGLHHGQRSIDAALAGELTL